MVEITAESGDITRLDVDAIVNAANSGLLGGGGVDGAIHRAAGPQLLEACRRLPRVHGIRCPVGEARVTPGFALAARFVIHTVGPIYGRHPAPQSALASAHRSSLLAAVDRGLSSVAFPAISCGVYGYPWDEAARIAIGVARERDWALARIRFVLYSPPLLEAWERALAAT